MYRQEEEEPEEAAAAGEDELLCATTRGDCELRSLLIKHYHVIEMFAHAVEASRVRNYWLSGTSKNSVRKEFILMGIPDWKPYPVKIKVSESQKLCKESKFIGMAFGKKMQIFFRNFTFCASLSEMLEI